MTIQESKSVDIEKIKNHWIDTSNDDFNTMEKLFKAKSYNWALFVGHISVEKILKPNYVKSNCLMDIPII